MPRLLLRQSKKKKSFERFSNFLTTLRPSPSAANMPSKSFGKVQKQISKKRGGKPTALHQNSRDAKRLQRAAKRDGKLDEAERLRMIQVTGTCQSSRIRTLYLPCNTNDSWNSIAGSALSNYCLRR